ncbi:MAG: ferritin family protein [Dehalococcoidia bacterium]|nr:ferritin family protein [Dehalococcoidia bacterium]
MTDIDTANLGAAEGIMLAIDIEKRGYNFYTEASAVTEDPRGRAMFSRLAQDEVRHLEWLTGHKESLEKSGHWKDIILSGKALALGGRVFPKSAGPKSGAKGKTRELEALRRGIQAEKDSMALYRALEAKIDDVRGKNTFQRLASEEEGHFHLLQAEHDYLSRSGFYFDMPEFSLEDLE